MPPLHHRAPGPVGAALSAAGRGEAVAELVADGVHLDDALAATVTGLVGPRQVALVTDAMAATGVGDGDYRLGGRAVRVTGGTARLLADGAASGAAAADGGPLAGGTSTLLDVLRRCANAGRTTSGALSMADVVTCASATPAAVLASRAPAQSPGAARARTEGASGPLGPGTPADILVVDNALRPVRVAVGGRWRETSITPGGAGPAPG
jgi:N-acetylglucosamine-6-phosphate deacetylase